jgi:hypothetical protein
VSVLADCNCVSQFFPLLLLPAAKVLMIIDEEIFIGATAL